MAAQGQQIASMFAKIGADVTELKAGMEQVRAELKQSEKGFDGFSLKSVMNIGKVTAALYTLKKGFDLAEQGAMLTRLETAGDNLAASYGVNMDKILAALNKAAHGTVASSDLMLSANRAMMLGVSTDADRLANLLEVAALRGRAMGLSTTQAFNDIVTGVGRMSPLILDNLGIVVDLERRTKEWAAANGVAVDSVDAATKREILFNGVLEEGNRQLKAAGGLLDDTATAYERFGAQGENAYNRLKKGAGDFFEPLVGWLADDLEATNKLNDAMALTGAKFDFVQQEGQGLVRVLVDTNGKVINSTELFAAYNVLLGATGKTMGDEFVPNVLHGGSAVKGLNGYLFELDAEHAVNELTELGDVAGKTADEIDAFYDLAKSNPLDNLFDVNKATEFYRLGGAAIKEFADSVAEDIANVDGILDEGLTADLESSELAAAALQVALGDLDASDAVKQLQGLPVPIENAHDKLQATIKLLTTADGTRASLWLDIGSNLPFNLLQQLLGLSRGETANALRYQGLAQSYNNDGTHDNDGNPRTGGGRAYGGSVAAGASYWIGERGMPELFTPTQSGKVTPASQVAGGARDVQRDPLEGLGAMIKQAISDGFRDAANKVF